MLRRDFISMMPAAGLGFSFTASFAQTKVNSKGKLSVAVLVDLINKGGRQRMLSQRMTKAYAQLGLGIMPDRGFKILNDSIKLFESHLQELLAFAPTPDIKISYQTLAQSWSVYKSLLLSAPDLVVGQQIYMQSDMVLKLANEGVEGLDRYLNLKAGTLVNVSGRQRMLSQRLAKKILFREWLNLKDNTLLIFNDETEFITASKSLENSQETTERIKLDLSFAQTQWLFFEAAIQASLNLKSDKTHLNNVVNTSERILELYESITSQFQKIA
jgi:hypothetical protein